MTRPAPRAKRRWYLWLFALVLALVLALFLLRRLVPKPPLLDPYGEPPPFGDVAFESAPAYGALPALYQALTQAHSSAYRQLAFRLEPGLSLDAFRDALASLSTDAHYTYAPTPAGGNNVLLLLECTPGVRMADAFQRGTEASLPERERAALAEAKAFLASLPRQPLWQTEYALHDFLCQRSAYTENPENPEHRTAVGLLLDGQGNCAAYADAFCMMARMAGIETYVITGDALDGAGAYQPHAWNLAKLGRRWYFVDVTFDDLDDPALPCFYGCLNLGETALAANHRWAEGALLGLTPIQTEDALYPYQNPSFPNAKTASTEAALREALTAFFASAQPGDALHLCLTYALDLDAATAWITENIHTGAAWRGYYQPQGPNLYWTLQIEP